MASPTTEIPPPAAVETPVPESTDTSVPPPTPLEHDPYRSVIWVLLVASWSGAIAAYYEADELTNPALSPISVTLAMTGGLLLGVAVAQMRRAGILPLRRVRRLTPDAAPEPDALNPVLARVEIARRFIVDTWTRVLALLGRIGLPRAIGLVTAVAGAASIGSLIRRNVFAIPQEPLASAIAAGVCLAAAGLAATAARYLGGVNPERLPESPALRKLARIVGWVLALAALSMGVAWTNSDAAMRVLFYGVLAINAALCLGLIAAKREETGAEEIFALDLGVLSVLGSRTNILASILDSAESQMGIDIRSTWALTVVRRSVEPLAIGLCFIGWLTTGLTVVAADEQGLIERLGVPVGDQSLMPGLHLHFPWPVDKVFRVPAQRAQLITIGHEGEEAGGPEDVLWARKHAENEYTLLLGNGRDLITVDAGIQFRIRDIRKWRYYTQNPADALRALGYRAVMRDTVNRTLSEALSENVAGLTGHMRSVVQRDADALGLGVEILGFTVGGMHPPVTVARDYQAVVSAELRKVTTVVNAQVYRNQAIPEAEIFALAGTNMVRAEGETALAKAAGEAWSFRTMQSQYQAEPAEYLFRRRLETLEKGLASRRFTVVDSRFERDGGLLWVIP